MAGPHDFSEAIDPDALKVVRRLLTAGHEAYLVGGCVRDLYLGRRPKDFDIATSATPEAIRRLFRNSRVIGRRFKLAHVFFGSKIIETSTFRTAPLSTGEDDPLITHDNEWGSVEDDARRRDFTINGLFFDVETEKIVDFVDGMADLDARLIRTIGDPGLRFREDPVRMIRAAKFAARLDFQFEPETYAALLEVAPDIVKCSKARVLEEIYKLLRSGSARRSFELLLEIGLFEHILGPYLRQFGEPDVAKAALLAAAKGDTDPLEPAALLWRLLGALDRYISQTDEAVINGVLQAILFAPMVGRDLAAGNRQNLDRTIDNRMGAVGAVLGIARRDRELARQILMAHQRLIEPAGRRKRSASMASRQYFHDALVFLAVWVDAIGDGRNELAQWQQMAQAPAAPPPQGNAGGRGGAGPGGGEAGGGRKRRRRGGRGRGNDDAAAPEPAADGGPEAHVDGT